MPNGSMRLELTAFAVDEILDRSTVAKTASKPDVYSQSER
jgi:hypothetical protein